MILRRTSELTQTAKSRDNSSMTNTFVTLHLIIWFIVDIKYWSVLSFISSCIKVLRTLAELSLYCSVLLILDHNNCRCHWPTLKGLDTSDTLWHWQVILKSQKQHVCFHLIGFVCGVRVSKSMRCMACGFVSEVINFSLQRWRKVGKLLKRLCSYPHLESKL